MNERWVDGFNVMHRLPGGAEELAADPEAARRRFLGLLAPQVYTSGERWTVVFDAPRAGRARAPGPIEVVYAPDADAWLVAALEQHPHPERVTVVTSDEKDIGRRARALGASVLSAAALVRAMAAGAPPPPPGPEKPEQVSAADLDYWLDAFGGGASGEPKSRFDTLGRENKSPVAEDKPPRKPKR
jgi:predicted RNA-binding protein with PIN domain